MVNQKERSELITREFSESLSNKMKKKTKATSQKGGWKHPPKKMDKVVPLYLIKFQMILLEPILWSWQGLGGV